MKSVFKVIVKNNELNPSSIVNHCDDVEIIFKKFSDGAIQITLPHHTLHGEYLVYATIVDSDGIIALMQINDVLRNVNLANVVDLELNYLPYARYDRRMNPYDSLSIKVFADIINSLNFTSVAIKDPHSNVGLALIDRSIHLFQELLIPSALIKGYDFIVSPDAGSVKKIESLSKEFNIPVIYAMKSRNVETGYTEFSGIMNPLPAEEYEGKKLLIVDDICDGGRTFSNLAQNIKALYNPAIVDLYVTHGIFSNGKNIESIDEVFFHNDLHSIIYKED